LNKIGKKHERGLCRDSSELGGLTCVLKFEDGEGMAPDTIVGKMWQIWPSIAGKVCQELQSDALPDMRPVNINSGRLLWGARARKA